MALAEQSANPFYEQDKSSSAMFETVSNNAVQCTIASPVSFAKDKYIVTIGGQYANNYSWKTSEGQTIADQSYGSSAFGGSFSLSHGFHNGFGIMTSLRFNSLPKIEYQNYYSTTIQPGVLNYDFNLAYKIIDYLSIFGGLTLTDEIVNYSNYPIGYYTETGTATQLKVGGQVGAIIEIPLTEYNDLYAQASYGNIVANGVAGINWKVTKNFGVFAQYRYQQFTGFTPSSDLITFEQNDLSFGGVEAGLQFMI